MKMENLKTMIKPLGFLTVPLCPLLIQLPTSLSLAWTYDEDNDGWTNMMTMKMIMQKRMKILRKPQFCNRASGKLLLLSSQIVNITMLTVPVGETLTYNGLLTKHKF